MELPTKREQLYWEDVEEGQEIPTGFDIELNPRRVFLQFSGTQDYYEAHHDRDFAKASGIPDVFLNTGFLTAALSRLLTDWIGVEGWIQKFRIEMRKMNFWGDNMVVRGEVTRKYIQDGANLADVNLWIETDREGVTTPCRATVKIPSRGVK